MRLAAAIAVLAAAAPAAAAPRASVLVVGRDGQALSGPRTVTVGTARVAVSSKRCRVGAGTALAALARTGLPLTVRDYGSCGRRASSAEALYVAAVAGQRERGRDGWVYKVGTRAPSTGAGSPSGAFKAGARVLWFWCRNGASGCQRTLSVSAPASVTANGSVSVTVTAYDDNGRGRPAAGAVVDAAGGGTVRTGSDGRATLSAPASGTLRLVATHDDMVRSFPQTVAIR